jgi:5,10-methylenetetrahydromethanopterin reductase
VVWWRHRGGVDGTWPSAQRLPVPADTDTSPSWGVRPDGAENRRTGRPRRLDRWAVDVSCAFATSLDTPDHIAIAEELGYRRAWCYDSPALYPDVWMTLGMAAERTSTIGLGPAVLVPALRHPMVNASAIAGLEALAPGRVAVAVGAGFTGRYTLGQRAMRWTDVAAYVEVLRALLRGDDVEWEGGLLRMIQPEDFVADRPIEVPILIGADGPKGRAVAERLGDGIFATSPTDGFDWSALLSFGTVLDDGEDVDSERARAAYGPGAVVAFHALYERGVDLSGFPGGAEWLAAIEAVPERERHLALHELHLVGVTERDLPAVNPDLARSFMLVGTVDELRERLDALEAAGVTEVAYQPAGPDITRELEAFAQLI